MQYYKLLYNEPLRHLKQFQQYTEILGVRALEALYRREISGRNVGYQPA